MRVPPALAAVAVILVVAGPALAGVVVPEAPAMATAWNTQRKLAEAPDGTLYATALAGGDDSEVGVWASRDGGASWTRLPAFAPDHAATLRSSVTVGPGGDLWLGWTGRSAATADLQVFAARWNGSAWSSPERVSDTEGYSGFPSLAVDDEGRVHGAWYGLDRGTYHVFVRTRAADGGWGSTHRLTVGEDDAVNPQLVLGPDRSGDVVHVVWYKRQSPVYRVYHAVGNASGWSAPTDLSGDRANALNPSADVDAAGQVHVAWDAPGPDGGAHRVWAMRLDAAGDALDAPEAVSPAGWAASAPSLAVDGAGAPVVAYQVEDGPVALQRLTGDEPFARVGSPGSGWPSLAPAGAAGPGEGATAHLLATVPADDGHRVVHRVLAGEDVGDPAGGDGGLLEDLPGWAVVLVGLGALTLWAGVSWALLRVVQGWTGVRREP